MFKKLIYLLLTLTLSCAREGQPTQERNDNKLDLLKEKVGLYTELLENHRDEHGFIMTEHCDATLFSGLLSAALKDIDLTVAKDEDGAWYRRPNKDCGSIYGNSRSTISRDMILGVFYYLWYNKDLDTAIELMDNLKNNLYLLKGQGTPGELFMIPSYMNTLANIILKLGGPEYDIELAFPAIFGKETGYVAHLTVLHILLRGEINGEISALDFNILEHHALRNPLNPLYLGAYHKYLDGNMTHVINLLLDNKEWPSDRLPTTSEHCSDWPVQRDYSDKDWGPCEPRKEHTGAELIIIYHLLILSPETEI